MADISYIVVNGVRYPVVDGTTVNIDGVVYTIEELLAIAQQPTSNNTEEPQQEQPSEPDNGTYPDVSYIVLNGDKYSIDDEQATTDLQKLQESIAHPYNDAITYSIGDYCIYSGYLFRCIFSIDTPEEFNQYHWELAVLTDNDVIESYNDLEDKPFINGVELQGGENTILIPSKTSDLQNDSGFITEEDIPQIPDKTSDLVNDKGFVNESEARAAAPVQSVNGQTGEVLLSIPSTASDVGAVAVAQGVDHAGEFVVVGSDGNITTVAMSEWQGGSY